PSRCDGRPPDGLRLATWLLACLPRERSRFAVSILPRRASRHNSQHPRRFRKPIVTSLYIPYYSFGLPAGLTWANSAHTMVGVGWPTAPDVSNSGPLVRTDSTWNLRHANLSQLRTR